METPSPTTYDSDKVERLIAKATIIQGDLNRMAQSPTQYYNLQSVEWSLAFTSVATIGQLDGYRALYVRGPIPSSIVYQHAELLELVYQANITYHYMLRQHEDGDKAIDHKGPLNVNGVCDLIGRLEKHMHVQALKADKGGKYGSGDKAGKANKRASWKGGNVMQWATRMLRV